VAGASAALLSVLQGLMRWLLAPADRLLAAGFQPGPLNPMRHLGALTIYFFWVVSFHSCIVTTT